MTRRNEVTITIYYQAKNAWLKIAVQPALQVGVIGVGIWAESAAMQWAGFVMLALMLVGSVGLIYDKNKALTIAGARRRLDELEREE